MDTSEWRRDWRLVSTFFAPDEIEALEKSLGEMEIANVVYCSFENRFAKSGGLAAVAANVLPYLKEVNKIPFVCLLTPLYPKLVKMSELKPSNISFDVPYAGRSVRATLYEYTLIYDKPGAGKLVEYYIGGDGFFGASKDPYIYDEGNQERNETLLRENSLFFCCAVPFAMKALGITANIVFHLQEWQTALIALTSKEAVLEGTLRSCATVQTMHNPYDSFFSEKELSEGVFDGWRRRNFDMGKGLTAYQIGLGLVDGPITTVSENFAREFVSDILQTKHFAPHLQDIFNHGGVFGVNNGMFVDFSPEFPKRHEHTISEVREVKLRNRRALLEILGQYRPRERFGELSYRDGPITDLPDNIPIFVMSGRLDPNQKGYDILLQAIEEFEADEIKVVMTPMPVRMSDLDFFYEVACKRKGNLTVFPTRMKEGFMELQLGSTFGVMPSIYEPFGAAVEYMANGTVNIARATGGLVDQIDDRCGISYREDGSDYTLNNIREFVGSSYFAQTRKRNQWASTMVGALHQSMREAVRLYQERPDEYYELVINGFKKAETFTWSAAALKYYEAYKAVTASMAT